MASPLHYAGPKPICSHHGVAFDEAHEDRYVYLELLTQLVEALQKRSPVDGTIHFGIKKRHWSDEELWEKIKRLFPDIQATVEAARAEADETIAHKEEEIDKHRRIDPQEAEIWAKNLALMRPVITQRQINKAVYHRLIDRLADLLAERGVARIEIPLMGRFHHALRSLANAIEAHHPGASVDMQLHESDTGPVLTLAFENLHT
jgi:hypothetical protein